MKNIFCCADCKTYKERKQRKGIIIKAMVYFPSMPRKGFFWLSKHLKILNCHSLQGWVKVMKHETNPSITLHAQSGNNLCTQQTTNIISSKYKHIRAKKAFCVLAFFFSFLQTPPCPFTLHLFYAMHASKNNI